jgi:serine/threonine-protein kinase PpkA
LSAETLRTLVTTRGIQEVAQQYGKWRVKEQIGQGGQGKALLVYDVNDQEKKPFVLKRLSNLKRLNRFEKEVRAGLELSHPNILRIVDKDLEHESPYFVADYCPGGALTFEHISQFPLTDRLRMFSAACRAVGFAHSKGYTHRDIKPDNIFLREDMTPVVGDFGLCFITEEGDRVTMLDEQVGSRWFMAADVYSLGKVLYWMLAGRPFDREEHRSPKFDLTKGQTAPDLFLIYDLLDKMIVKEPQERFVNALEAADAVDETIRLIEVKAHLLDLKVPQQCNYCGRGVYKPVADTTSLNDRSGVPDVHNFGFEIIGRPLWLILACNHCGNVQMFRPDYSENRNAWRK